MFQHFHFKIVHSANFKHANVDALSKNLVDRYEVNEDFGNEIQDLTGITLDAFKPSFRKDNENVINLFIVLIGEKKTMMLIITKEGKSSLLSKLKTPPQVEIGQ